LDFGDQQRLAFSCDVDTKGDLHADLQGCVWFVDKGGLDIDIHGYRDMDIHIIYLVGRMGRAIFLFGSMDMCWTGRAIFCLVGWTREMQSPPIQIGEVTQKTCTTTAIHVQNT